MGERKAIFLDVDGTLVDEVGQIPESAVGAVREARERGHLVFLCTGRSLVELWPEILEIGFDGMVAASGSYVQAGDEVLSHRRLSTDQIDRVLGFFGDHGIDLYFQASDGIYATPEARRHLKRVIHRSVGDEDVLAELERGLFGFIDSIRVDTDPRLASITKVIYFDSSLPIEVINHEFGSDFEVVRSSVPLFGEGAGEMSLRGVHKAAGIDILIQHLGIDRADTIGVGDNYNDLEMLAHVGVGIAMGNAPDSVKEVAHEVTAAVDEDGIELAFRRHGLIGGDAPAP